MPGDTAAPGWSRQRSSLTADRGVSQTGFFYLGLTCCQEDPKYIYILIP